MRKVFLLVLLPVFLSCAASNKKLKEDKILSFMVYGDDFLSNIALPNTWHVDMEYARQNGINGFFYLRNYNADNSPAVITLDLAYKSNVNSKLEEWSENNINNFLEYYNGFTAEKLNWETVNKNNYKMIVYSLKNDEKDALQYSAYLDVNLGYFVNLYITIKDKSRHDEMINDFKICLENSLFTEIGTEVIDGN
ncbi:MAG: hypothetical protein LBU85_04000 [Treponema sp.]|jgi:hypothetical protein|nr:hypothetical protein [Treponema sp.]